MLIKQYLPTRVKQITAKLKQHQLCNGTYCHVSILPTLRLLVKFWCFFVVTFFRQEIHRWSSTRSRAGRSGRRWRAGTAGPTLGRAMVWRQRSLTRRDYLILPIGWWASPKEEALSLSLSPSLSLFVREVHHHHHVRTYLGVPMCMYVQ